MPRHPASANARCGTAARAGRPGPVCRYGMTRRNDTATSWAPGVSAGSPRISRRSWRNHQPSRRPARQARTRRPPTSHGESVGRIAVDRHGQVGEAGDRQRADPGQSERAGRTRRRSSAAHRRAGRSASWRHVLVSRSPDQRPAYDENLHALVEKRKKCQAVPCTAVDRRLPVGEPARERDVEQLLAHHLGAAAQRLAQVVRATGRCSGPGSRGAARARRRAGAPRRGRPRPLRRPHRRSRSCRG